LGTDPSEIYETVFDWLNQPFINSNANDILVVDALREKAALDQRLNNGELSQANYDSLVARPNRILDFHDQNPSNLDVYGDLLEAAAFGVAGLVVNAALGTTTAIRGLSQAAKFAQQSYNRFFSSTGAEIYSKLAGQSIRTIDDLADAIRSGKVNPSDIVVETIQRDGQTLILNTRTAKALEEAGIPRSAISTKDVTGDELKEGLLDNQLRRLNKELGRDPSDNTGISETTNVYESPPVALLPGH